MLFIILIILIVTLIGYTCIKGMNEISYNTAIVPN